MAIRDRIRHRKKISTTHNWTVFAAACAAVVLFASAPAYSFLARPVIFAALGSVAKAPSGWLRFCEENPQECLPMAEEPRNVELTPELLQQLFAINAYVNRRVTWTSDAELYGKAERWTYPLDRGDCEDIVLLKRRLLAKAGWPLGTLLITTVEEPAARNTRHAVLTVRTDRGELILDNQTPEILFWYETNYRYLTRQSPADPNVWVSFLAQQPRPHPEPAAR
jgi:predicted transglutaminase-like cysteine proteinase